MKESRADHVVVGSAGFYGIKEILEVQMARCQEGRLFNIVGWHCYADTVKNIVILKA